MAVNELLCFVKRHKLPSVSGDKCIIKCSIIFVITVIMMIIFLAIIIILIIDLKFNKIILKNQINAKVIHICRRGF